MRIQAIREFARAYRVPLIDYDRAGDWLLIGSGCGLMLAVMDAQPRFRWCVDIDALPAGSRLADWLLCMDRLVGRLALVGWFSITDPGPLRAAIAGLERRPLAYTPGADFGAEACGTLGEFLDRLADATGEPPWRQPARRPDGS